MDSKSLERVFYGKPFKPFRLTLDDGEEITVRKPRKALLSGDQIAVVGIVRNGSRGAERLRIVRSNRVRTAVTVRLD